MKDKASFGPFGLFAEIVIVALGALGVAAMFQDYAWLHNPDRVTPENVALKYGAIVISSVLYTIGMRQRRRNLEAEK